MLQIHNSYRPVLLLSDNWLLLTVDAPWRRISHIFCLKPMNPVFFFNLTLIRMAIKKYIVVELGVIYDSQATNRKQGGLPVRAPRPLPHSYWSPGSHIRLPAHKKIPTNRWKLLLLIDKSSKTAFW
jgi:hypothetical protein